MLDICAAGKNFHGLVQKAQKMDHIGTPPQLTSVADMKITDLVDSLKKECSGSHRDPGMCPICNKLFTKRSNLFTHARKLHKINFTLLLKGRYSGFTHLREIINTNNAAEQEDMNEQTEEEEEEEEKSIMELTSNLELLVEETTDNKNVLPESYTAMEMIEVKTEDMVTELKEDEALIVQDQDGTVMHVYEMPQISE